MKKKVTFDLDKDCFAPELEKWSVWVDGESEGRTVLGRSAALKLIERFKLNHRDIPPEKMPTFRMKLIPGRGLPFV